MLKVYDNDDYKANIDGIDCITTPELNTELVVLSALGLPTLAIILNILIIVCL